MICTASIQKDTKNRQKKNIYTEQNKDEKNKKQIQDAMSAQLQFQLQTK